MLGPNRSSTRSQFTNLCLLFHSPCFTCHALLAYVRSFVRYESLAICQRLLHSPCAVLEATADRFAAAGENVEGAVNRERYLQTAFDTIDRHRTGFITSAQLRSFLKVWLGTDLPQEVVDGIVAGVDQDSDGKIDIHEFRAVADRLGRDL